MCATPESAPARDEDATAHECGPARAPKIVVVEDDAEMGCALGRLLKVAGFEVVTVASAEAFLAGDAAAGAACLIFDVQLPGLSGFDLLLRFREGGVATPVVFITAHDDESLRARARAAGAVACISKPFALQELLEAMASAGVAERKPRKP